MDAAKISEIADIMKSHGLSRVRVEEPDGSAVELECGPACPPPPMPPAQPGGPRPLGPGPFPGGAPAPAPGEAPFPGAATTPGAAPAASAPAPADDETLDMSHATAVRAPMVGVFYAAPAPGAEPFVQVGSKVKKGDTLCVIEAMKVMNEVTAEADGEVVDVCVKDGDLVEYGCCLMKIY